jgi:hypothetical protein
MPHTTYTRRERILLALVRAVMKWDDSDWPEKRILGVQLPYAPEWGVIGLVCRSLCTHVVANDHCGLPDHRYCAACGRLTPNAPLAGTAADQARQ